MIHLGICFLIVMLPISTYTLIACYCMHTLIACTTQLVQVYHKILKALDNKHSVDVIYLDFQKAFDKVSHRLLLRKLRKHGFYGSILNWFES